MGLESEVALAAAEYPGVKAAPVIAIYDSL